jgi:hypothetical protein
MKKLIFSILISLVVLSSCNFPLQKTVTPAEIIGTRVAQTSVALPPTEATAIISIQPSQITATLNSIALPTVTPSPTPTLADFKTTLGSPAFADTFTTSSGFGLSSGPYIDDAVKISIQSGVLELASIAAGNGIRWRLSSVIPANVYLEGTFKTITCTGQDHYGLVLRAPNFTDGFGFYYGISCNGQIFFQRWDSSGISTIYNWTPESHILTGSGQTNRIGVAAKGDSFKLYVNGTLVKEFTDAGLPSKGHFGVFINAQESSNFSVNVEEISYWNLP